jgi:hypothetical protein
MLLNRQSLNLPLFSISISSLRAEKTFPPSLRVEEQQSAENKSSEEAALAENVFIAPEELIYSLASLAPALRLTFIVFSADVNI